MNSKLERTLLILAVSLGSAYLGDEWNINMRAYHFFNKNKSVAVGFPRDYYNFGTLMNQNRNGETEVYFGNKAKNEFIQVNENGTVGDFSIMMNQEYKHLKEKLETFIEKELEDYEINK
jgi:hypothetical protein